MDWESFFIKKRNKIFLKNCNINKEVGNLVVKCSHIKPQNIGLCQSLSLVLSISSSPHAPIYGPPCRSFRSHTLTPEQDPFSKTS